jgi:methyltransferase
MSVLAIVLVIVALQRIAELIYAERNTRALRARGAVEIAAYQYPFIVAFHAAWFIALSFQMQKPPAPNWWLLAVFVLLQLSRIWVLVTLGPYWTTRIITVPNEPLIKRGPYRFMSHPNYVIVALEIAVLPLAFGAWQLAIIATIVNTALLIWRISAENAVLNSRRGLPSSP